MFRRFAAFALIALISTACGGKVDESDGRNSARQLGGQGGADPVDAGSSSSPPSDRADAPTTPPSTGTISTGSCKSEPPTELLAEFEDGAIDTRFSVANPVPFSIDTNNPLFGKASLRLRPTNSQPAYLLYDTGGSCEVWIKLAVRADAAFVAGSGSIFSAYAKSRTFYFLTDPGGDIRVAQEGHFGSGALGAVGMAPGAVIGTLVADRLTVLKLHVNLTTGTAEVGFDDTEAPLALFNLDVPLSEPAAFTGVMFGIVPRIALDPKGTLWMDDVAVK